MKSMLNFVLALFIVGLVLLAGARQMAKQVEAAKQAESLNAITLQVKP